MNGAFYIGATGLDAQQKALDVVANNIANINTVGFKRSTVQFSELVGSVRDGQDQPVTALDSSATLAGVAVSGTPRVWTEGPFNQTGSALDLAINGTGFIELLGAAGRSLLWRGGTMTVNADGYLAAGDGTALRGQIAIPANATSLTIDPTGVVSASVNGQSKQLGQIDLVSVKDPNTLVDDGNGMFEPADPSDVVSGRAGEDGLGTFVQGSIEGGNVQLTDEMVNMLLVQRAYGADAQMLQAGDQLMSIANNLRR